jgi:hypothetical protein
MTLAVSLQNSTIWQDLLKQDHYKKVNSLQNLCMESDAGLRMLASETTVEELAVLLNTHPEQTLVVTYLQAEHALAFGIGQQPLEQLAFDWLETHEALVSLQRQHRDKLKLVNLLQLISVKHYSELLNELGFNEAIEIKPEFNSFALLAACQYVAQHSDIVNLNRLLQTSSLPLQEDNFIQLNIENICIEQHREQQQLLTLEQELDSKSQTANYLSAHSEHLAQQLRAKNEELKILATSFSRSEINERNLKDENELLIKQLMLLQEELERYFKSQQQLEADFTLRQAIADKDKGKLAKQLETKVKQIEQKDEKLRLLSRKLKEARQQKHEQEAYCEKLLRQCEEKQNDIELITQEKNTLKQENKSLIEQLSKEIENCNSVKQQFAERLKDSDNEKAIALKSYKELQNQLLTIKRQHQRDINKAKQQVNEQKQIINALSLSEHQLQRQLKSVENSTVWRAIKPVRRLAKLVAKPDKKAAQLQQDIALLFTSEYFDAQWYMQTYPDLVTASINPAEHYLRFGAAEGRLPSPLFDGNWYLNRYPDVAAAGLNPLIHYIKFGRNEGRMLSPKLLQHHNEHGKGN